MNDHCTRPMKRLRPVWTHSRSTRPRNHPQEDVRGPTASTGSECDGNSQPEAHTCRHREDATHRGHTGTPGSSFQTCSTTHRSRKRRNRCPRLDARIMRTRNEEAMEPGEQDYEHLVRKCIRDGEMSPPSSPATTIDTGDWCSPPDSPYSMGRMSETSWTSEEEGECEIERIIDRKPTEDGSQQYRVRWAGYGAREDRWYTREQLAAAPRPRFVTLSIQ